MVRQQQSYITAGTNEWEVVSYDHNRRNEEAAGSEAHALLQNMSDMWVQKLSQRLQMQTMPGRQPPLEETRTRRQVDRAPSLSPPSATLMSTRPRTVSHAIHF